MLPAHRGPFTRGGTFFERLGDPALYAAAAETIRQRQARRGDSRPLVVGGPALASVVDMPGFVRRLAREVGQGTYQFEPIVPHAAWIHGKSRTLYRSVPLDEVVRTALASALAEPLGRFLSDRVFSYRTGRSSWSAIAELCHYLRQHVRGRPDPRSRGLYVVRRDIQNYGEAIPAAEGSQLWQLLSDALASAGSPPTSAQLGWLRSAFRPPQAAPGGAYTPEAGIPTGSPLQPAACNVYLTPLDRLARSVPGAFYARYGDDVLFVHDDPVATREMQRAIDGMIASLGLHLSADKCASGYFTGAGRASAQHADFRNVSSVAYLGVRVDFRGGVGLKREKSRSLLRDVHVRLRQSDALLTGTPADERARALCAVASAALDPTHPGAHPSASWLRHVVDDRALLRDLDNKLVLLVAQQLASRRGVRALRSHPPRRLRTLGLVSLVHARNQVGRSR